MVEDTMIQKTDFIQKFIDVFIFELICLHALFRFINYYIHPTQRYHRTKLIIFVVVS